jgi:riboflavin kinase/FMN adenylyltransferase
VTDVLKKPVSATLESMPAAWRNAVVAIGNFDGVHLGHQAVLAAAHAEAERRGVAAVMLTLEPHPRAFFSRRPLFRLTPAPLKAALAAAVGLDGTLVLPFDRTLAEMSAEDFVQRILMQQLAIGAAVTGYDFQFGKARRGTAQFLTAEGVSHGFAVTVVDALRDAEDAVSSTRIRAALGRGDVDVAAALLGWRYAIAGTVVHGDRRGRELGYPTANMALDASTGLAHGIYAVRFIRHDGSVHEGVASYGRRPTFGGGEPVLETFLFDFEGDLYGEAALVAFCGFIRAEKRFETVGALVERMEADSIEARGMLDRLPPGDLDRRLYAAWAELPSPNGSSEDRSPHR